MAGGEGHFAPPSALASAALHWSMSRESRSPNASTIARRASNISGAAAIRWAFMAPLRGVSRQTALSLWSTIFPQAKRHGPGVWRVSQSASGGYPARRRFWFSCSMVCIVLVFYWFRLRSGEKQSVESGQMRRGELSVTTKRDCSAEDLRRGIA